MQTLAGLTNAIDPASLIATFGTIGLLVIIFAETGLLIGFFLPGDTLLFLAGAYCATGPGSTDPRLNLAVILPGAVLAAIVGAQTGWDIGRRTGPRLFARESSKLFSRHNIDRAQKLLDRFGMGRAIVIARFVPIARTFLNPVAGAVGVPARVFLLWNVVGALLWVPVVTLLGYWLGEKVSIDRYILPVVGLIIVASIASLVVESRRSKRRAASPPA